MINVLLVCRETMSNAADFNKLINNSFTPDKYDVTTVFLHGKMMPEQTSTYYGEVVFWQLEQSFFKQKFICALRLLRLYQKRRFKLVICDQYKATAIVDLLQKWVKIPELFSIMRALDHYQSGKRKEFIRNKISPNFHFIAVSNAVKQSLLKAAPQIDHEKIRVIYSVIDSDALEEIKLSRIEARSKLAIVPNSFVFGTIGQSYANGCKGHDLLIAAFAKVHKDMPDAELIMIGGGELLLQLKAQIQRLNLIDRVKLIEFLPQAAVYMSAFDVFVLPSQLEAFGKVLLEAMVSKRPIIATTAGGIPEIMGDAARLVPVNDVDALAVEMRRLYHMSAAERAALGEHIAQRLSAFRLEAMQADYRSLCSR
ncbi:MAG: glycosyltransferase [Gammaproteobacteria bacterium]|nr:glycosyltransferase [Gammaproteobacteria bacterium]